MSELLPFSRWRFSRVCVSHEEGEVCTCAEDDKARLWLLEGTTGAVQQFYGAGPFYGTWEAGRTGAVDTLDACKAAVEKAVWHG